MNKKKSPIKWLEEELKEQGFLYDLDIEVGNDMFRECIKLAYAEGVARANNKITILPIEYFKETYGSI